jgi:hypothetical protein
VADIDASNAPDRLTGVVLQEIVYLAAKSGIVKQQSAYVRLAFKCDEQIASVERLDLRRQYFVEDADLTSLFLIS